MSFKYIYESYKISNKLYQKKFLSKHWQKNNIKKKNLFKLKNLESFRNNGLADGLGGGYFSKESIRKMYKYLKKTIGQKKLLKNLNKKNIGSYRNIIKVNKKVLDANQLMSIEYLFELKKKLNLKKLKIICEIGAGYGCFAEKLINNSKAKYVIIDLPEANFLSSYYLKKNFPNKKFLFANKIKSKTVTLKTIKNYDIIILNPWHQIKNINFDLFINIRSMMEMDSRTIKYYFEFINKNLKKNGYFLNINRYQKDTVGYPIKFCEYPYGNYWSKVISKTSWQQDHTHFLLAQKKNSVGDIKKELNYINVMTKKRKFVIDKFFLKRFLPNIIFVNLRKFKNFIFK